MAVSNGFMTVDRSMNSRNVSLLFTTPKERFSQVNGQQRQMHSKRIHLSATWMDFGCRQQFSFSFGQKASQKVIDQSIEAQWMDFLSDFYFLKNFGLCVCVCVQLWPPSRSGVCPGGRCDKNVAANWMEVIRLASGVVLQLSIDRNAHSSSRTESGQEFYFPWTNRKTFKESRDSSNLKLMNLKKNGGGRVARVTDGLELTAPFSADSSADGRKWRAGNFPICGHSTPPDGASRRRCYRRLYSNFRSCDETHLSISHLLIWIIIGLCVCVLRRKCRRKWDVTSAAWWPIVSQRPLAAGGGSLFFSRFFFMKAKRQRFSRLISC